MRLLLAACLLFLPLGSAGAQTITTDAPNAILIDVATDTVLFERNADQRMPTASMSKVMTMYLVFQALDEGFWSLDDTLTVSEYAWREGGAASGGSTSFLDLGSEVRIEDLIRGVIIQSGNDAAIVLAEGLAGTEEAFAAMMNAVAAELGMANSNFRNATGLPDPDHYSTPRDLARLARRLIADFPHHYAYYAEESFTYNGIRQGNRNPLLYRSIGADGVKTGYTEEAGYCLIGSSVQDGRRLISVVAGLPSAQARADESAKLLGWGHRFFDVYALVTAGQKVGEVPVWLGERSVVDLIAQDDVLVTLPRTDAGQIEATLSLRAPLDAPVEAGTVVGALQVPLPDGGLAEVSVSTAEGTARLQTAARMGVALRGLLFGSESR